MALSKFERAGILTTTTVVNRVRINGPGKGDRGELDIQTRN
jgi:hypothetical protein